MLFNSYEFLFLYFPVVVLGFFFIARWRPVAAAGWLGAASLFFYGWWSVTALPLLIGSVCVNYLFGKALSPAANDNPTARKVMLYLALAANLGVLAFFKYANFFVDNANAVLIFWGRSPLPLLEVVLPIGISFFTFTQIAFLVDCWRGEVRERNFVHYLLFVTYFPHLIAGPVLHHAQMMPQFARPETYRPHYDKIALGVAIFTIGLAKKVLIANTLAEYADGYYGGLEQGIEPQMAVSWLGTLSYTFQIYFDFSGYSDMAIGLALFMGVRLPVNFFSPYKSTSIIEFWRRWHITLSTFLRDYLYFPLGGNRKGPVRRYINLLITMVLGGLWHGASWTFVLWGALHGVFLMVNHAWRNLRAENARRGSRQGRWGTFAAWLVTFICINASWVLFRAESLGDAVRVYKGLLGLNGVSADRWAWITVSYSHSLFSATLILALLIAVAGQPTQTWSERYLSGGRPLVAPWTTASLLKAGFVMSLFWFSVLRLGEHNPFLYFQF